MQVRVRANATRLTSRVRQLINATRMAPYALSEVAVQTIGDVSDNAVTRLAGREDQVGFDLPQFLSNIREPGEIEVIGGARGRVGILDTHKMGTVADLDAIGGDPGLWHTGRRAALAFKIAVYDDPGVRDELARARQAVWGSKTPQWYLLEHGTLGVAGAYPQSPPAHFIQSATRADRIALRMRNAMTSLFKGIPRR